jgi:hypothetical protein
VTAAYHANAYEFAAAQEVLLRPRPLTGEDHRATVIRLSRSGWTRAE